MMSTKSSTDSKACSGLGACTSLEEQCKQLHKRCAHMEWLNLEFRFQLREYKEKLER